MAHGSQKLKHIDYATPAAVNAPVGVGRSKELIRNRNTVLIARYYYYNIVKQAKYEDTVRMLVNEFWIAEYTISKILEANMTAVKEMRKAKPTVVELRKQFTSFNW